MRGTTINGIKVSWDGSKVSRWQKHGKDRLYLTGTNNYVDLQDLENEIGAEFVNPYGWNSERLFDDDHKRIGTRHEFRGSYVEIIRL